MPDTTIRKKLMAIYRALYKAYGPQHWWPGDTPFEVMVGAVLTQNTAWTNVEKAIANLRRERLLTPARLDGVPAARLAQLIRPSGYYNIKAKRLKHLLRFLSARYSGSLRKMFSDDPGTLRKNLLTVNGIGQETADSIMLYAAGLPFFVVDAYTIRIMSRHGLIAPASQYRQVQELIVRNLRRDPRLYNEYHALIVRTAKEYCRKTVPLCTECPLHPFLP